MMINDDQTFSPKKKKGPAGAAQPARKKKGVRGFGVSNRPKGKWPLQGSRGPMGSPSAISVGCGGLVNQRPNLVLQMVEPPSIRSSRVPWFVRTAPHS